ncbi:pre T-cell antigen receptor alpha isoform X1 [Mycteria americana]|uniref:pre T-cell antigen receptor alpha isoform X1 n=1 Tax=Mycteria americana TaxID=33587 RepID=UPI003F585827
MPFGSPVGMAASCSPLPMGTPRRMVAPPAPSPSSPTTHWPRGISPATWGPTGPPRPTAPAPSASRVRPCCHPFCPSCPLLPSLVPRWPPRMGAGGEQVQGPAGQRCCPNQRVQEGVCGWPHCTPGAGPLLPPQLLSHPTGNEEVAEPCPGSMAAPLARASAALLVAVRVVLLKVALSDALLTSILLTQS